MIFSGYDFWHTPINKKSINKTTMENLEKLKSWIGLIALIAIGIYMIADPGLMDGAEAGGRRGLIKQLIIWVWSWPVGILLVLFGGFIGYIRIYRIVGIIIRLTILIVARSRQFQKSRSIPVRTTTEK